MADTYAVTHRSPFANVSSRLAVFSLLLTAMLMPAPVAVRGAMVLGPWVDRADQDIREHRQRRVRIIVLTATGRVVEGAEVRVEQIALSFELGARFDEENAKPLEALSRARRLGLPLRAFAGEADPGPFPDAEAMREDPPPVRLAGPLISSDLAKWPDAWARLEATALRDPLLERILRGANHAQRAIPLGDVLRPTLAVEQRLGPGFARLAMQKVRSRYETVQRGVLARDALMGAKQDEMLRRVLELREAFVPFEFVAITHRDATPLPPRRMADELRRLRSLDRPIVVLDLQTGGENAIEAAKHAETLLRLLFAMPEVEGVYFPGVGPRAFAEPYASLVDEQGHLTAVGRVVARLFGETWRSNETLRTDAAGNAHARLFHGTHRVTATLPGGETVETEVRVEPGEDTKIIALQMLR